MINVINSTWEEMAHLRSGATWTGWRKGPGPARQRALSSPSDTRGQGGWGKGLLTPWPWTPDRSFRVRRREVRRQPTDPVWGEEDTEPRGAWSAPYCGPYTPIL